MGPTTVEIVFAIDTSESMRPCIEGLSKNLDKLILPFKGYNFKVRYGLFGYAVGKSDTGGYIYPTVTLNGDMFSIYQNPDGLFTENAKEFSQKIKQLNLAGDEDHLFALDCAFDFPFGPVNNTRRVVCLFSDERIEDGTIRKENVEAVVEKLMEKATARRILLFMALPESPLLNLLGQIRYSQIQKVNGGDGLASLNFSSLLESMGKSISVASIQGQEREYEKAIYGQTTWGRGTGNYDGMR